jgi:hypothetical protein
MGKLFIIRDICVLAAPLATDNLRSSAALVLPYLKPALLCISMVRFKY